MRAYSYALGMIETWGFPALVAAADAAAKAADVQVVTYEGADAGIVTVYVIGDVSSVQAAVDAGSEAAQRVGRLLHSHVIPRPDDQVPRMVKKLFGEKTEAAAQVRGAETEAGKKAGEPAGLSGVEGSAADLQAMSINDLRKLARSLAEFPLSQQEINTARKEELIRHLEAMRMEGGEHAK